MELLELWNIIFIVMKTFELSNSEVILFSYIWVTPQVLTKFILFRVLFKLWKCISDPLIPENNVSRMDARSMILPVWYRACIRQIEYYHINLQVNEYYEVATLGDKVSAQNGMIQFESDNSLLLTANVPVWPSVSVIRKLHFCIC